jgi:hypothetical protein
MLLIGFVNLRPKQADCREIPPIRLIDTILWHKP